MCILNLSKILMHHFHYNYIKGKVRNQTNADTDSLVYDIEANDTYEDFYRNKDIFYFNEYLDNSEVL